MDIDQEKPGIFPSFMIPYHIKPRRVDWQREREHIEGKNGEKSCLAKKSRKRRDNDDLKKESTPSRTPKR